MTPVIETTPTIAATTNGANGHAPRPRSRDELIAALMREPGKAEIIGGRIKHFDMTGDKPSRAARNIVFALMLWKKASGATGEPYTDGAAFLCDLAHRQSFSPDAAYYTGVLSGMKFLPEPPVFAVEVRSENDYGAATDREMQDKRADYFATATEVVWGVDLLGETVIVSKYTKAGGATTPVAIFKRGDVADAEPAAPGFTITVDDLFA